MTDRISHEEARDIVKAVPILDMPSIPPNPEGTSRQRLLRYIDQQSALDARPKTEGALVEAVAKAIYHAHGGTDEGIKAASGSERVPWDELAEWQRDEFRDDAIAAIVVVERNALDARPKPSGDRVAVVRGFLEEVRDYTNPRDEADSEKDARELLCRLNLDALSAPTGGELDDADLAIVEFIDEHSASCETVSMPLVHWQRLSAALRAGAAARSASRPVGEADVRSTILDAVRVTRAHGYPEDDQADIIGSAVIALLEKLGAVK